MHHSTFLEDGDPMRPPKRITAWGLAMVGIPTLYFGIIPYSLWPAPSVAVDVPEEQPFDQDLPVKVDVSAWHSNARLRNVRFYIDVAKTTAHGEDERLSSTTLFNSGETPASSSFRSVSRVTWPNSKTHTLNLPLAKWASEDRVQPGLLIGKVDVELSYPLMQRPLSMFYGHRQTRRRISVPFTIQLQR
jgi:hypothetical protein